MRHVIPISGKDSLAAAIVQMTNEPDLEYDFFVNVIGRELPEFYSWISKVEERFSISIERVGSDLSEIIRNEKILPSRLVRYCTRKAKIGPMEDYLGSDESIVYFGIRADEDSRLGYSGSGNITPSYPLIDNGIDILGVWSLLSSLDLLPPPFLFDEVVEEVRGMMGADFSIADSLRPWHYRSLFTGRTRAFNCYDCFFMRRYELAYISINYPELYEESIEIEESTGSSEFTLVNGISLREIREKAPGIITRRAKTVRRVLYKVSQVSMFDEDVEELSLVSCGVFCGK